MESFQREMGRFSLVAFVVDVENLLINNHQKKLAIIDYLLKSMIVADLIL